MGKVIKLEETRNKRFDKFLEDSLKDLSILTDKFYEASEREAYIAKRNIEDLESRLKDAPDNIEILLKLVSEHNKLPEDYGVVTEICNKIISLDPRNAEAYFNLGLVYEYDLEDFKEAERLYLKAISIEPKNIIYYNELIDLYLKKGDIEQAEFWCKKAAEFAPTISFITSLTDIYQKKGEIDKRIDLLEKTRDELKDSDDEKNQRYYSRICLFLIDCYKPKGQPLLANAVMQGLSDFMNNAKPRVKIYTKTTVALRELINN